MNEQLQKFNSPERKKTKLTPQLREMIFLAEQATVGGIKVVPGNSWAYHYKKNPAEREEILEGVLSGKYDAKDVEDSLKPDALIYNINDLETKGLEVVSARIMDETASLAYTDYKQYSEFLKGLNGLSIDPKRANEIYDQLTKGRTQKSLRDALSSSGKRLLDSSLAEESKNTIQNLDNTDRIKKVIDVLKLDWLHEEMGVVDSITRDQAVSGLSGDERKTFDEMKKQYRDFVQRGDVAAYDDLIIQFKNNLPKLQKQVEQGGSESMQELEKELEQQEEVGNPGTERDPAIPPEDNDEYHTPAGNKDNQGKQESGPAEYFFKIEPPLGGYYVSGKKSYFDINRKVWSKQKQLIPYSNALFEKGKTYTMEGATKGGIISVPLPTGYAIDLNSISHKGEKPSISRDQNGCFYVETNGSSSFSFDFKKEENVFTSQPISEDTKMLYNGSLSQRTEQFLSRVTGGSIQKTEQIRQHILANHFYPGGGDLAMAQKVQAKLRNETTGDNYLQTIDTSEYLECYSANTKFIAMLRKVGVPSRLVLGHHVEGSQKGISYIDSNNGHAWAEIWDGKIWRRFDATPPPKPEDKKEDDKDNKQKQDGAPEAEDGGIDSPQEKQEQQKQDKEGEGEGKKSEKQEQNSSESSSEKPGEASDKDLQEGQEKLEQAKEVLEQAEKNKKEAMDQVEKAETFEELNRMKEELENKELLEEMKDVIEDAIEAKENLMKEELKEELEKMAEDGFLDDEKKEKLLEKLMEESGQILDKLQKEIEEGNQLYNDYESIKLEIEPMVDEWFKYFVERLPRQKEVSVDEDALSRQGAFDRRSVNRPRNILFGTVKNPRIIDSSIKPLFIASIMVDVSGSMGGIKLENARKLLIFYCELFTKIKEEFGYIQFAINTFSDSMQEIKTYEQDYDSTQAYVYPDNTKSTVKLRLMKNIKTQGGTNMLDPIKRASRSLSDLTYDNSDHASSFYFIGDGEDTNGNSERIKQFLLEKNNQDGFGEHMLSAILLGSERERTELSKIFGDEHTTVAGDFDELIKQSMERFEDDIEEYLRGKV